MPLTNKPTICSLEQFPMTETTSTLRTWNPSHQAPQLVANLPVAIELGHPTGSLDPKLPLEFGRLDSPSKGWE